MSWWCCQKAPASCEWCDPAVEWSSRIQNAGVDNCDFGICWQGVLYQACDCDNYDGEYDLDTVACGAEYEGSGLNLPIWGGGGPNGCEYALFQRQELTSYLVGADRYVELRVGAYIEGQAASYERWYFRKNLGPAATWAEDCDTYFLDWVALTYWKAETTHFGGVFGCDLTGATVSIKASPTTPPPPPPP